MRLLKQVIEIFEILDNPKVTGEILKKYFKNAYPDVDFEIVRITGKNAPVDFIKITIEGRNGKKRGGDAPTLGVIGTLGGIGARPEICGFTSDGDGALTALAAGLKICEMKKRGDCLEGDVIVTTHVCPFSPILPHDPVPFMDAPVSDEIINRYTVLEEMDGIISVDTTKGNEIINHKGFAITCTVKEGYILKVSKDLLDIMKITTGIPPVVLPISQQDITPYGNGISHLNSILQPSTCTDKPVVGLAITTETVVPGCSSGATHLVDVEQAARFIVEVAKYFSRGQCKFYDVDEFNRLKKLYGSQKKYQTQGLNTGRKVGLITMGKSNRKDMKEDIEDILQPKFDIVGIGILDGYSFEEIKENFWPEDGESFIVSMIDDGQVVKISESNAFKLIGEKINILENEGIICNMLMCTGKFPDFDNKGILLRPERIIYSILKGMDIKKLGIIVPDEEQVNDSLKQYYEFNPEIVAASPYGSIDDIGRASSKLSKDVDLVLLDCMGFTENMKKIVEDKTGLKVMLPRTLVAGILNNIA